MTVRFRHPIESQRIVQKREFANCPASCSALMGGCKETIHARCCQLLPTNAAFTMKKATWHTAQVKGNAQYIPNRVNSQYDESEMVMRWIVCISKRFMKFSTLWFSSRHVIYWAYYKLFTVNTSIYGNASFVQTLNALVSVAYSICSFKCLLLFYVLHCNNFVFGNKSISNMHFLRSKVSPEFCCKSNCHFLPMLCLTKEAWNTR